VQFLVRGCESCGGNYCAGLGFSLNTSFFPTISAEFHNPHTHVFIFHSCYIKLAVGNMKTYIYIYMNPNILLFLMHKKFLSLFANFHFSFHETTMPTLSHLTYCTPTNCGLIFASSVFCVSMFNVPFSIA
jgi:hypothetical protein